MSLLLIVNIQTLASVIYGCLEKHSFKSCNWSNYKKLFNFRFWKPIPGRAVSVNFPRCGYIKKLIEKQEWLPRTMQDFSSISENIACIIFDNDPRWNSPAPVCIFKAPISRCSCNYSDGMYDWGGCFLVPWVLGLLLISFYPGSKAFHVSQGLHSSRTCPVPSATGKK